jgi:choline dehydrogenase
MTAYRLQILEFSGIGNPEVLTKIGVKPIAELPGVGENVQEHIFTSFAFGTILSPFWRY